MCNVTYLVHSVEDLIPVSSVYFREGICSQWGLTFVECICSFRFMVITLATDLVLSLNIAIFLFCKQRLKFLLYLLIRVCVCVYLCLACVG